MKAILFSAALAFLLCLACLGNAPCTAEMMDGVNSNVMGMAEKSNDCMYKLSRGVANVALGWAEFPKMSMSKEGPGVGLQRAAARTGGGLIDIVTFPMASEDEKSYIEPEYFSP
jgi:putative exosortase-associated protein (TIGR04073 family)